MVSTLAAIGNAAIGSFPIGGSMDPVVMGRFLVLDGAILRRRIRVQTLEVTLALGGRRRLECVYWAPAGGEHLVPGRWLVYRDDAVSVFRGTIETTEAEEVPGNVALATRLQAVDGVAILERRRIPAEETHVVTTAGAIVRTVVSTHLADESITTESVQDGPAVNSFTIKAFATVADVLRDLSDLTGFVWFVDAIGDLHFEPQDDVAAPFGIADLVGGSYGDGPYGEGVYGSALDVTSESPLQGTVRVTSGRERYRNRQTVRFGANLDQLVTVNDTAQQAARRELEGGTGIYHAVRDEKEIATGAEATALADALLRRYGAIPQRLEFSIRKRGLRPGQTLAVALPAYALAADFLVDQVTVRDDGADPTLYEVTALSGEHLGQEETFWRAVVER